MRKKKENDQTITKNAPIRMILEELAETEADEEEKEMIVEASKEEVKKFTTWIECKKILNKEGNHRLLTLKNLKELKLLLEAYVDLEAFGEVEAAMEIMRIEQIVEVIVEIEAIVEVYEAEVTEVAVDMEKNAIMMTSIHVHSEKENMNLLLIEVEEDIEEETKMERDTL